jgi:nitrate/nitrite transporter NarK
MLTMVVLTLSGEAIFMLPFVLARVFRPTLLAVFEITNFQLGTFFSVYGVVALAAYLLGGPLADRFQPAKLMSVALFTTGLGGLYMTTIPSPSEMKLLYGFWGITTILLFWAAMIKATRRLGGDDIQGLAFGLLDGGRGLVSAIIGSSAVFLLAWFLPEEVSTATLAQRTEAFVHVIQFVSGLVLLMSAVVWFALPKSDVSEGIRGEALSISHIRNVLKMPSVWMQSAIIVCAYSGYKVTDDFSLLAKEVLLFDEVDAAKVGTLSLWLRPIAAITAGFLADKMSASLMLFACFTFTLIGGLLIGFGIADASITWLIFIALVSTCLGVFALRGLYFAIMQEAQIPLRTTGTAVGIASIIGYTPDIYMGPLMGTLLDNSPGAAGHQHVFLLLAGFSIAGLVATIAFRKITPN